MKILIVGGGGREHALAWKIAQSPRAERVFVAPGNGGTALEPGIQNVPIGTEDLSALRKFALQEHIDLTLVGPEAPLVGGIVDQFQEAGLRCFGPSAAAARLEGSKAFAKAFLQRHHIPTAAYTSFSDLDEALAHLENRGFPLVVKADGLAAGKGVTIARNRGQAEEALRGMLTGNQFGSAGNRVVVEDFLEGEEASFIVMASGGRILPLATSQDHKPRDDGDTGPNTGGMGAYSPAPVVTPEVYERILSEVIEPTISGLAAEGIAYTGFLYAGLMIGADGTPRVLEYNCRFGDPEAQPVLMRLRSDLLELVLAAVEERLAGVTALWEERAALGVVMASGGYPGAYASGLPITGAAGNPHPDDETKVFHAGTVLEAGKLLTHGGRVLCVTALGDTVTRAQEKAYARIRDIRWEGAYFRTDIGHRAIAREKMSHSE